MELIDPACVPDTFVEGIGQIAKTNGGNLRFTLYATRVRGEGDIERVVVAQIVWPAALIEGALAQCRAFVETGTFLPLEAPPGIVPS